MNVRERRIDLGVAVLTTVVVLIVAPGLAFVSLIALLVLIACGVSVVRERRRRFRRR